MNVLQRSMHKYKFKTNLWKDRPSNRTTIQQFCKHLSSTSNVRTYSYLLLAIVVEELNSLVLTYNNLYL